MMPFNEILTNVACEILPSTRIEAVVLPNKTGIHLYLINGDYPSGRVSREDFLKLVEQPFYWAFCWAAGIVISRFIIDNPHLVRNKRIVDFGCGSGVAAIASAKAGAGEVIACDIDPFAIAAAAENAKLNRADIIFCDDFNKIKGDIDLVIMADVLYDKDNLPVLQHLRERAEKVIIADSRIKDFNEQGYRMIYHQTAATFPDLGEPEEFSDVRLYST